MPWGNGTGPAGLGPMTGRGAGYCAGFPVPGFANPIPGGRFGYAPYYGGGYASAYPFVRRMPYAAPYYGGYSGYGAFPRFGLGWGRGRGGGPGMGRGGRFW